MQALSPEQYAHLRELAAAWRKHCLAAARGEPHFNPRLEADALCFQVHDDELLGALVTPLSLSLAIVPVHSDRPAPPPGEQRRVQFPSGAYDFVAEYFDEDHWIWRCILLDDLSDIEARQQASRLAQQLMERVMAPPSSD